MHLVQELPDFDYFLRGADGQSAWVNEQRLLTSFILAPHTLLPGWAPRHLDEVDEDGLAAVLALKPEILLLGTGAQQGFLPAALTAFLLQRHIGIECMSNAAAARTFNVLAGEGRRVVAAFLLDGSAAAPGT